MAPETPENLILWIGQLEKYGLRHWAITMERILREYPAYRWVILGWSWGKKDRSTTAWAFHGLQLPHDRIEIARVSINEVAHTASRARAVLVSMGLDAACGAALEAHAMGRPVLSGDGMVFKYANPDGTGLRVRSGEHRYRALKLLIDDPDLGDRLGRASKAHVLANYTEPNLRRDSRSCCASSRYGSS